MRESGTRRNQLTMYSLVAPNKELRDASVEAEKSFSDFDVETRFVPLLDGLLYVSTRMQVRTRVCREGFMVIIGTGGSLSRSTEWVVLNVMPDGL